jgi:hypothetical protein
VDDAKESRNDRDAVMLGKPVCDRPLGGAIESDDQQRDQEMIFAHGQKMNDRNTSSLYFIAFAGAAVTPRLFL